MDVTHPEISVVIPVYRSEDILAETVRQVVEALTDFGKPFEVLLVNDGSPDNSDRVLRGMASRYQEVSGIQLARNYGQHTAVLCGMKYAKGALIVTMDDDLQNPPSEISTLYNKAVEGYDLVFARFDKKMHSVYRCLGSCLVRLLNRRVFGLPRHIVMTNFRIFTKEVSERAIRRRTAEPYIPGLLLLSVSPERIANVTTSHAPRVAGQSNYSIVEILALVARILFNYSSFPLQFLTGLGGIVSAGSFLWGAAAILAHAFHGTTAQGWTTIVVLLSFLNGFMILLLGVLGEYVIRITKAVSMDEPYEVAEIV